MMNHPAELDIRQLAVDELPLAEEIARQVWPSAYRDVITPEQIEYMLQWMYSLETMSREVTEQNIVYDLLSIDGVPVGFASYGPYENSTAKLHKLYILPEYQHRGLGTKLMRHVVDEAKKGNFKELILNVNKQNTQAVNAYIKFGFHKKRETVDDIGNGFVMDDYIMAYDLSV